MTSLGFHAITTSLTLPYRKDRVGLGIAILLLAVSGVSAIMVISSILSPRWVTAGWGDTDDSGSPYTSPPLSWSPFRYCRGSYCFSLPSTSMTSLLDCTGPDAPASYDTVASDMRGAQALSIMAFLALFASMLICCGLLIWIVSTRMALNRIDDAYSAQAAGGGGGGAGYRQQAVRSNYYSEEEVEPFGDSVRSRSLHPVQQQQQIQGTIVHVLRSSSPVRSLPVQAVAMSIVEAAAAAIRKDLQQAVDNIDTGRRGQTRSQLSPEEAQTKIEAAIDSMHAARTTFAARPLRQLRRLPRLWIALVVLLFVSTLFCAVTIGLFDKMQNGTLSCGVDYCQVLGAAAGNPCGRGAAYRSFLGATIMSGLSLLMALGLFVLSRRPLEVATTFTENFYDMMTDASREVEHELVLLRHSLESATTTLSPKKSTKIGRGGESVRVPSMAVTAGAASSTRQRDTAGEHHSGRLPSPQQRPVAPPHLADGSHEPTGSALVGPDEPGWVYVPQELLFYSAERQLYYDPATFWYYDPKSTQWWDGEEWRRFPPPLQL